MFGINGPEMVIIIIVALLVIGPQRLPEYAEQLKNFVKMLKQRADEAKGSLKRDFGDELSDVDWQSLDPRQYDPRRIVREALQEENEAAGSRSRGAGQPGSAALGSETSPSDAGASASGAVATQLSPIDRYRAQAALRNRELPPPYDPEAT